MMIYEWISSGLDRWNCSSWMQQQKSMSFDDKYYLNYSFDAIFFMQIGY